MGVASCQRRGMIVGNKLYGVMVGAAVGVLGGCASSGHRVATGTTGSRTSAAPALAPASWAGSHVGDGCHVVRTLGRYADSPKVSADERLVVQRLFVVLSSLQPPSLRNSRCWSASLGRGHMSASTTLCLETLNATEMLARSPGVPPEARLLSRQAERLIKLRHPNCDSS
jgi:hypothetical protein